MITNDWYYHVELIDTYSTRISTFYIFEVKFSMPTSLYPVPQVTVSIYFQFEVSKVIPASSIVKVHYKVEGSSFVFTPGRDILKEKFLARIADCKLNSFKEIKW